MENSEKTKIVIMAAGKGTRMESDLPKVLAPLKGKPMIRHLLETMSKIYKGKPIAIVGYKKELVKKELGNLCSYALQKKQLGTAHAVACAEKKCGNAENIIVLSSDQPYVKEETIIESLKKHKKSKAKITFTTTVVPNFEGWRKYFLSHGRILRKKREIIGIREYKDASEKEKRIKEVNTACCYVFDAKWLWKNLKKVKNENLKGEYYLTDLIQIARDSGEKIENIKMENYESLGANSKEELEILEKFAV